MNVGKGKIKKEIVKELSREEPFRSVSAEIAKLRKAEKRAKEEGAKYRSIFESAGLGIFQTTPDGRFLSANPALAGIYGYTSPEEMMGSVSDIEGQLYVNPDDRRRLKTLYEQRGSVAKFETPMYRKDGSKVWISMNGRVVKDKSGKILYYEGTVEDITDRKRTEEEIRRHKERLEQIVVERTAELGASEKKYRSLVDHALVGICQTDLDGNVLYANDRFARMFGFSAPEHALSSNLPARYKNGKDGGILIKDIIESGRVSTSKATLLTDGGQPIHVLISANVQDRIISWMIMDITDHRNAQKALEESENKFRDLVEKSIVGVYLIQDNLFQYVNAKFAEIFGYLIEEIVGKKGPEDLVFPEDYHVVEGSIYRRISGNEVSPRHEFRGTRKNGEVINAEAYVSRTTYRGRLAAIGTLMDITERKKADQELRKKGDELEHKTRSLQDMNATLRVLLQQREQDKRDLEERLLANVERLIMPSLKNLKSTRMNGDQNVYLRTLETNLKEIISPFLNTLTTGFSHLTPRELQIANLIKNGMTTKEIAAQLHVSEGAVEIHRKHLRNKLSLTNKKTNLQTYLLSLSI